MVKPIDGTTVKFTEADRAEAVRLIGSLNAQSSAREAKYNRNLNRYYNSGRNMGDASATIWNIGYQSVGFNRVFYNDNSVQTRINIIKSATDTVVSKVSQARVRPFFDAVRGTYETVKAARSAQDFFDQFFDAQKIYERAPETMRAAMLFDGGHFWIDEDNLCIQPLAHWELFVNPYEVNAVGLRNVSYGMIYKRAYPLAMVRRQFPKSEALKAYKDASRESAGQYIILYDLDAGRKWYVYESTVIWCKEIEYKRLPVTALWWSSPIIGWSTTCLGDDLYTIQVTIDEIQLRIDQALKQSAFNTTYIPEGSNVKATMLTNEAGLVVPYMEGPSGGVPVVATPAPISPMYQSLLDRYIQMAYELAGISQLSAQSKKPAGVTAGVALQTLEDIESERHNVTVQAYIHQFVEIAEIAVEVFPSNADVLPATMNRARISWGDIKRQKDLFRIQFSAGSALAKDPATKIQQIQALQQLGINLQPILPQLLEIPDLETAYSATTASYDYVQSVIQRAAETGEVDFLAIVNMEMLFTETIRWMLRLSADDANKKYLENLNKLLNEVMEAKKATELPPPEMIAPPVAPAAPAIPAVPVEGGV